MSSQGVSIITQLVLPPMFLRSYGVAIHYNRGEIEEAHIVQSTSLLLLLIIIASAALLTIVVFFLPINVWLGLRTDAFTVSATIYLLGLQILSRMLYGFF